MFTSPRVTSRLASSLCWLSSSLLLSAGPLSAQTIEDPRRATILDIAQRYAEHRWRAQKSNLLHGKDADGVPVDTADFTMHEQGWRPGEVNVGVPYQWGGFISLEQFDAGIAEGKLGGHLPKGRSAAASRNAVGVDCSGFVSVCWELPEKQSTRSLPDLCYPLQGFDDLQPGDILNTFNGHAMIFQEFIDRENMRVYEAGTPKVKQSEYSIELLEQRGFIPLRYRPLDPRWQEDSIAFESPTLAAPADRSLEWRSLDKEQTLESLADLGGPFEYSEPGDWVRYQVRPSRPSGTVPASYVWTGLVTYDDSIARIHERSGDASGRVLDRLTTHEIDTWMLEPWLRPLAPAHKMVDLQETRCDLQEGEVEWADTLLSALQVDAEVEAEFQAVTGNLDLRITVDGIWSDEIPVRGFLAVRFQIFVGEEQEPALTSEYRLLEMARATG